MRAPELIDGSIRDGSFPHLPRKARWRRRSSSRRKTGGWNIGRALGERDDVARVQVCRPPHASRLRTVGHNAEGVANVEGREK
jgi:hypothetical protein